MGNLENQEGQFNKGRESKVQGTRSGRTLVHGHPAQVLMHTLLGLISDTLGIYTPQKTWSYLSYFFVWWHFATQGHHIYSHIKVSFLSEERSLSQLTLIIDALMAICEVPINNMNHCALIIICQVILYLSFFQKQVKNPCFNFFRWH